MERNDSSTLCELERLLFGMTLDRLEARLAWHHGLARVWALIQAEYHDAALDLPRAAATAVLGKDVLNRWLRARVGDTFYDLLSRYRVYRSIVTLLEKEGTLTEVALSSGFDSLRGEAAGNVCSRYGRTVRRFLGVSPSQLVPRGPDRQRVLNLDRARRLQPGFGSSAGSASAAGRSGGGDSCRNGPGGIAGSGSIFFSSPTPGQSRAGRAPASTAAHRRMSAGRSTATRFNLLGHRQTPSLVFLSGLVEPGLWSRGAVFARRFLSEFFVSASDSYGLEES